MKRMLRRRTQDDEEGLRREGDTRVSATSAHRSHEMRDPRAVYERRLPYVADQSRERYPRGRLTEIERRRPNPSPQDPPPPSSGQRQSRLAPQALDQSGYYTYAVYGPNLRDDTAQPRGRRHRHSPVPKYSELSHSPRDH